MNTKSLTFLAILFTCQTAIAQKSNYEQAIKANADKIEQKVIAWRHDFHQNPELGNRETRTLSHYSKTFAVARFGGTNGDCSHGSSWNFKRGKTRTCDSLKGEI